MPIWYTADMFERLFKRQKNTQTRSEVVHVAQKQLDENRAVIESLRDYDIGKKDISTADIERRLRDIRATS